MSTDFKGLCAELADALETWQLGGAPPEDTADADLIARARTALAQPEPEVVGPSDEEIMGLMPQQMHEDLAAAVRAMAEQEGIDSTPAKGVMRIMLNRHVVDLARAVLARYARPAIKPVPDADLPPRVGHVLRLAEIIREVDGGHDLGAAALAEAILSHAGSMWRPAIEPVPVSERPILKSSNFNDANGHCWCGTSASVDETGDLSVEMPPSWELREPCAQDNCVLPYHALPVPTP